MPNLTTMLGLTEKIFGFIQYYISMASNEDFDRIKHYKFIDLSAVKDSLSVMTKTNLKLS